MRWIRQSTSVDLPIGPFVDTNGAAATGLTLTQPDIRLKKNGGAWAQKNAAQTLSHEENGNYEVTLDATDTNTLGHLRLHVAETGALAVWENFLVVPANVYDALVLGSDALDVSTIQFAGVALTQSGGRPEVNLSHVAGSAVSTGSAQLGVNVVQISADATAADNLEAMFDDDSVGAVPAAGIVDRGTGQSATSTTFVIRASASLADDICIGGTLAVFSSTQGYWQFREIKDYVQSTKTITVDAWTVTPSGTLTYRIYGGVPVPATPPAVSLTHVMGRPLVADGTDTPNYGVNP